MVILITGATHTGKTALARKLVDRTRFFCLSADHLKMGLIRSGQTPLTPEDDKELTACLWPILREMIKTVIENRQDLIVEGCYIPPDWRKDFDGRYLPAIRAVCLALSDDYIDAHFDEIRSHACDAEARLDDAYCTPELLKRDNRAVRESFRRAGEAVALIEDDYAKTLETILLRLEGMEA